MIPLLKGIRLLEISSVVMGPYAGQVLADLGAESLKIEPLEGDVARVANPQGAGSAALFINNNRNKRSIALDLKNPQGSEILTRLIGRSDVLLHNMRPDAARRLGLDFEAAAAINPRLIYCSTMGFGRRGRYRDRPAYDDVVQAAAGAAWIGERDGEEPRYIPTIVADKVAALHAVYGVLAALVARERGQAGAIRVEVPMFEALTSFLLNEHLAAATFSETGKAGFPRVMARGRRPYRTSDGWIAVLPYMKEHWRRFLVEAGRKDVLEWNWFEHDVQRHARIHELYDVLAESLPQRTSAQWLEVLSRLDIPCAAVNTLDDLLDDPHLQDVNFFGVGERYPKEIKRTLPQPVDFGDIEAEADRPPPALGAHTQEVLAECGYSPEEIGMFIALGVAHGRGAIPP